MGVFDNLIKKMKEKRPILLLGAGFSYGAYNGEGKSVPMGEALSIALFDNFYAGSSTISPGVSKDTLNRITDNKKNLRVICSALRAQNKVEERNKFITKQFTGCYVNDGAPQNSIVNYPWTYIFSLNIDDLVENIYQRAGLPITVWDYSHSEVSSDPNVPILVKLHGSVNDNKTGYVFDDEEYRDFTIASMSLLKEFGHQVVQNDLVMVGTEFQEDDLLSIISIYEKSGYEGNKYKRFYISPSISNISLNLRINSSMTEEWICATTRDFMDILNKHITVPSEKKQLLKENGVYFLDDHNRQSPSNFGIYRGEVSTYADFFHNVDIQHQDNAKWRKIVESSDKKCIISFWGDEYIGKTCYAKRLLVDLYNCGYDAMSISFFSSRISSLLLDYWRSKEEGTKQAIFVEGAAYSYLEIGKIYKMCPSNVSKLVFIIEDSKENHKTKRYQLMDEANFYEIEIFPEMNTMIAESVYEKLATKRRLGHYIEKIPPRSNPFNSDSKKSIISCIKNEQDIIDALYFATEGRSFKNHYEGWIRNKACDSEVKHLKQLCVLSQLGINRIPISLFNQIGWALNRNFTFREYYKKYGEVLFIDRGYVCLRRSRILLEILKPIDISLVTNVLLQTAAYCVPLNEDIPSEQHTIFQKAIRVRRIRNNNLLYDTEIINLFERLESLCKHMSYFWVQYGIAAQVSRKYEDANNHLLYAKNMRPDSYQVKHALAKNSMEWGLWLIQQGSIDEGKCKFEEGTNELQDLIYNDSYKRSFRYSVHTKVYMWLRYSKITHTQLESSIYYEISTLLSEVLRGPLDDMLIMLIKDFIKHCNEYGLGSYCTDLKKVYSKKPIRKADKETYSID